MTVDYEKDVLPLTPSFNPTERHIVLAYIKISTEILKEKSAGFWSHILGIPENEVKIMTKERPAELQEKIRTRLIKAGGPGYILPEKETFPALDDVVKNTLDAKGIPVGTWLDGTSEGEKDPGEHLEILTGKGIKAVAIIPERNWNIKNPEEKKTKTDNLKKFLEECKRRKVPVIPGTEMNKSGQPFVDDFSQPVLAEYLPYFIESAELLLKQVSS